MKKIRLKKVKKLCYDPRDGLDSKLIYRRLSTYFVWIFQYLPITPNGVTFLGTIAAMIGAYLILTTNYYLTILGTLFLHFHIVLDHADGGLAIIKNQKSAKGEFYDIVSDGLVEFLTMITLGAYSYLLTKNIIYIFVTGSLILFYTLNTYNKLSFINVKGLKYNRDFKKKGLLKLVYSNYFFEICGLMTITSLFGAMHYFALFLAVFLPIRYCVLLFYLSKLLEDKNLKII